MILSDGEIRQAIAKGHIKFTPELDEEYLSVALTTSALDLRLGDELQWYEDPEKVLPVGLAEPPVIDPSTPGLIPDLIAKWGRRISIADEHHDLQPHHFVLGTTLERVELPEAGGIAARVEGKSTLARLGFSVHMTAPTIHSGFRGHITLEILNFGVYPLRLTPGVRICQLIFERLGEPPIVAQESQYLDQASPSGSAEPPS